MGTSRWVIEKYRQALFELLGDHGERGARSLADAEREVPCLSAHRDHEVPARGGLCVDHQVLHDLDADVARGLETEGVDVLRKVEVVVDRLRDVHDAQHSARGLRETRRAEARVVAADRDEHADAESIERVEALREELRALRGVRARDAEARTAAKVDSARIGDGQRRNARGVTLDEPLEAVLDAEHLDARQTCTNGGGTDDAIDAGGRTATDEDGELLVRLHGGLHCTLYPP